MHVEQTNTENDNAMETDVEQVNENLCRACGQAQIDRSESANSMLCHECRERFIRYPIPKIFIVFSIIIVVIIGAAFCRFPKVLECYKIYENSLVQADNGESSDALKNLKIVLEKYPDSTPIACRMTEIAMDGGYYDIAGYVISTYLAGKEMDKNIVTKYNQYIDKIERYYTSYDAMEAMNSKYEKSALPPEQMKKECYDHIKVLLNDSNQDKAVLYYYLSVFAADANETKICLENCINEDNKFLEAKVELATMMRRQGDLTNAEESYNEVLREDKHYSGALRGLAIIKLLNEDKEAGLDLAHQAFENNPDGLYVWETYIIALNENAKKSKVNEEIKKYKAKGKVLEEDTQSYLEGKTSLHDYYVGQ